MSAAVRALALVGPTACGKAQLGLEVADRFELPILVCDSVKVYRGLDIGTAKPNAAARSRVVHHLIDIVDPDEAFSAGDYARQAHRLLGAGLAPDQPHISGLFVGGTGFYLRSAAWSSTGFGESELSTPSDAPERARFDSSWVARDEDDPGAMHRALQSLDPETARSIHPNNRVRLVRALWLCRVHGGPVSAARRADPPKKRIRLMMVVVDPGQTAIDVAIARRLDKMLESGWLEEVENLKKAGYDGRYKAMQTVGYRELLDVVERRASLRQARERIVTATRQLARRQRTYFRRQVEPDARFDIQDPAQFPWARAAEFLAGGLR